MGSVKISFLGDVSLNNRYNNLYEDGMNPFARIYEELKSSNMVFGNLECLSKGDKGENILKKPRLNTQQQTLNYLKNIPVSVATLANNHVYDGLIDGFIKTKEILDDNNIEYFGIGKNEQSARKPLYKTIGEINFAFLNYVTHDTNPKLPEDAELIPNFFDQKSVEADIKEARNKATYVIVLLHWGGRVENGLFPDWNQPTMARQLIDSGCDLVIGHHSHTIQPFEVYRGKYIFYSLGNFCFDDILFKNKLYWKLNSRNKEALIVTANFTLDNYSINIKTYKNRKLFLAPSNLSKVKFMIRNTYYKLVKRVYPLWFLYYFKLTVINPVLFFIFREEDTVINKLKRVKSKISIFR